MKYGALKKQTRYTISCELTEDIAYPLALGRDVSEIFRDSDVNLFVNHVAPHQVSHMVDVESGRNL